MTEGHWKGAITIQYTVWCGGTCHFWDYLSTDANSLSSAKKEAFMRGWRFSRAGGWKCPSCAGTSASYAADKNWEAHNA